MIEDAEEKGFLKPGHIVLESSTGNTGIALSFVGCLKGYNVIIYETTPGKIGAKKRKIMRSYGADVRSLPPEELERMREKSVAGAEVEKPRRQMCLELRKPIRLLVGAAIQQPGECLLIVETGREILEQTDGKVDVFVASIGTGGTLKGIAEVLKEANPRVRVVGIQPASSKIIMTPGVPYPRSEVDGGIVAEMLEAKGLIDGVVRVTDEEAVAMTRRLWRAGFFAGVSSGANVLVALREGKKFPDGNVVTLLPDSGDRYFTEEHYVT